MSGRSEDRIGRLVGRVLGPAEPEISCEECFEQLDRYVELELSSAAVDDAVPGMRAHLEGCAACAEDRESLHTFLSRGEGSR
jgi:hypothetical protein